MFFQQLHIADDHAAVGGLAHVVDGQQGDLHGGQGFHFHAGGAHSLGAGGADHALLLGLDLKVHGHPGQGNRVAQRDQVGGALGAHNARQARHAQHIAFAGMALGDQAQGLGQHLDVPAGHGHAPGGGLGPHVHHVGLALGIEMGKGAGAGGGHGAAGGGCGR